MLSLQRAGALRREMAAARHIPYSAHVAEKVVRTVFGDYVQVFRLGGASFESADDVYLNTLNERLNVLWRNIASPNVALWAQVIRRRESYGQRDEPARYAGRWPRHGTSPTAPMWRKKWCGPCLATTCRYFGWVVPVSRAPTMST